MCACVCVVCMHGVYATSWCQLLPATAGVFMCLRPAPAMMEAALSAGLLGLMHKILNCRTSKPLRLDMAALKGARIADGDQAANKLLTGAQRYPRLCPQAPPSTVTRCAPGHEQLVSCALMPFRSGESTRQSA